MMLLTSENRKETLLGLFLVVAGIALRLLPHAENFAPVMAIALFSGMVLPPAIALTVPLIIMIATDIFIGPHDLFALTWGSFFIVSVLGVKLSRHAGWGRALGGTLAGSVIYFIVTNLGVFFFQDMYPRTWEGLETCFWMAVPFFRNSLLSDLFYIVLLFGAFSFGKNFITRFSTQAFKAGFK